MEALEHLPRYQGTSGHFVSRVKDDRFVMVRSKGNAKKVGTTPNKEYMELRSMSKRPLHSQMVNHELMNMYDDSTAKPQNVLLNSEIKKNIYVKNKGFNKVRLEKTEETPTIILRSGCAKFSRCRCFIYCISGLSAILLCALIINLCFPYPLHASCIVKWKFGDSCIYTMHKFRAQMLNWSPCFNCGPRGSKCLYALKEPKPEESNTIRAVHLAPNMRTEETIKITFEETNKTCLATGESVSNEWFRIFDYGTNYCNLHNLVIGIGFDKNSRFLELTSNAICTQYNMAVCD